MGSIINWSCSDCFNIFFEPNGKATEMPFATTGRKIIKRKRKKIGKLQNLAEISWSFQETLKKPINKRAGAKPAPFLYPLFLFEKREGRESAG